MKNQIQRDREAKLFPENFNEGAADNCVHPRRANVKTKEHHGKEKLGEAEPHESNKSKHPRDHQMLREGNLRAKPKLHLLMSTPELFLFLSRRSTARGFSSLVQSQCSQL